MHRFSKGKAKARKLPQKTAQSLPAVEPSILAQRGATEKRGGTKSQASDCGLTATSRGKARIRVGARIGQLLQGLVGP